MEMHAHARAQLAELTGMTAETVSSLEQTEDGWALEVEVLELSRVPDTMSLLASYRVELDRRGELTGYRRVRRYERGRADAHPRPVNGPVHEPHIRHVRITRPHRQGGDGRYDRCPGTAERRGRRRSGLYDVLELVLDRGLVIDAFVRVSLVGIEILKIDVRVVVASVDTYLRFAEACNRLDLESGAQGPRPARPGRRDHRVRRAGQVQGRAVRRRRDHLRRLPAVP